MKHTSAVTGKSRNGAIDVLRFYFTIAVVIAHMIPLFFNDTEINLPFRNGHLSVEFFFIVSGFLMAASCIKAYSQKEITGIATFHFLRHKIQALYSVWIVSWFISILFFFTNHSFNLSEIWRSLPAILMIQNLGFKDAHNVPWGWYIPTMILGMAILFPLCYRFRKTFTYLMAPLIALFCAVFLFQKNGKILALQDEWLIIIYPQEIRALCGLCLGCSAWTVAEKLKELDGKITVAGTVFFSLLELLCWAVPVISLLNAVPNYMQLPFMLCCMAGTALAFSNLTWQSRVIRGPFFGWIGRISYAIYLA